MSALFNFQSMLTCVILAICSCSYIRSRFPAYIQPKREGIGGVLGKLAVIGDRLSAYVSAACILMAILTIVVR